MSLELITTASEFRALFLAKVGDAQSIRLGGMDVPRELLLEAFEETIGAMVDKYMNNRDPDACVRLVGQLIMDWLQQP